MSFAGSAGTFHAGQRERQNPESFLHFPQILSVDVLGHAFIFTHVRWLMNEFVFWNVDLLARPPHPAYHRTIPSLLDFRFPDDYRATNKAPYHCNGHAPPWQACAYRYEYEIYYPMHPCRLLQFRSFARFFGVYAFLDEILFDFASRDFNWFNVFNGSWYLHFFIKVAL
jgi:hypothetical protein